MSNVKESQTGGIGHVKCSAQAKFSIYNFLSSSIHANHHSTSLIMIIKPVHHVSTPSAPSKPLAVSNISPGAMLRPQGFIPGLTPQSPLTTASDLTPGLSMHVTFP